jgi:hypothetical protein
VSLEKAITPELRARMLRLSPAAIERFESFGRADRREGAIAVLLAGAAPLAGLLLLGWEPAAVLVSLLLNLLLGLADDAVKILIARGRSLEVRQERAEDEFVWPLARTLARGRVAMPAKWLPSESDLVELRSQMPLAGAILMACMSSGLALPLMYGSGASIGSGTMVVLGSLPSVLLTVGFSILHGFNRHAEWRRAASVRLQTSAATGFFIFYLGMFVLLGVASPHKPLLSEHALAVVCTTVTMGFGGWRIWVLRDMEFALQKLQRGELEPTQGQRR